MANEATLFERAKQSFPQLAGSISFAYDEVTIEVPANISHATLQKLESDDNLAFDTCIDICGVDYQAYGVSEWETCDATANGFDRGVERVHEDCSPKWEKPRFAVVYHLLSVKNNWRVRVRVFADEALPMVDSVIDIWRCADWFEREAFDLYGILFNGHPDLRRILTDYGFVGHPFRKDFPLTGEVEMRYDAALGRVLYEPVSIEPRTLVPRVIRDDSRYLEEQEQVVEDKS